MAGHTRLIDYMGKFPETKVITDANPTGPLTTDRTEVNWISYFSKVAKLQSQLDDYKARTLALHKTGTPAAFV